MKKILIVLCTVFTSIAIANTTNWYVDGTLYQTTSCLSGNDVTPPNAPTKRGYTFSGWMNADLIIGTWSQSGTPSPTNPVYPVFYQNGNLILRAVGTGNNLIADTYDTQTGKLIRRIKVLMLKGTENWSKYSGNDWTFLLPMAGWFYNQVICTHFPYQSAWNTQLGITLGDNQTNGIHLGAKGIFSTVDELKTWLAGQYAAGTPVTIYYTLKNPTTENYTPTP